MSTLPPFSARNRGAKPQIDNDFPESARTGLLHLVSRLVNKGYVENWAAVRQEVYRIGRVRLGDEVGVDEVLYGLPWQKVCDFCERLYSHLKCVTTTVELQRMNTNSQVHEPTHRHT